MMRDDMFKVIVERPRNVRSNSYDGDGRIYRNSADAPLKLGMKKGYGYRKHFNENLAPLKRFLEKQVGRPWDKVYSEIRAVIDARSTMKHHILQHLDDFVAIHTQWKADANGNPGDGEIWGTWRYGGMVPLKELRIGLYVHPQTGLLCRNRQYVSWSDKQRDARQKLEQRVLERRHVVSRLVQLLCIDGIWYEVELDILPPPRKVQGLKTTKLVHAYRRDCVLNCSVSLDARSDDGSRSHASRLHWYGDPELYAKSKRQLSSQELRKHGVINKALRGLVFSGRFVFMVEGL